MSKNKPGNHLWTLLELSKIKITAAVTLSTFTGFVLYSGEITLTCLYAILGVFFLAGSSSIINEIQERKYDAIMPRTKARPIPSGKTSVIWAWFIALLFFIAGSLFLYLFTNLTALMLGWFSLFWYNAVYTYLKRFTVFAVIVGSLIGAIPPVIGFVSAGGMISDPRILMLAFFFYFWQVPHFVMLLIKYGEEYELAGYESLSKYFTEFQLRKIIFSWMIGLAIVTSFLPFFGVIRSFYGIVLIAAASALLIILFICLVQKKKEFKLTNAFIKINVFLIVVMGIVVVDNAF